MKAFGMRALKWPLSRKDVQENVAAIHEGRITFNLQHSADERSKVRCPRLFFSWGHNNFSHMTQRLRQSVAEVSQSYVEFCDDHGDFMKKE